MAASFIVRPIDRAGARAMCEAHPHAKTLPNSGRYYMRLDIAGRPAGLAVWGWGVRPTVTASHMFGEAGRVGDYLELCRFFVFDWCPRNTASRFLATTHRLLKKYAPHVKWLYTYAAGFQGMVGHIYKAAGYDYLGKTLCNAFYYVPKVGLLHWVSLWHRYPSIWAHCRASIAPLRALFGDVYIWCGYNFRYLYWLCDAAEKARLMQHATFTVQPYPTEADLEIWLEDERGRHTPLTPEFARTVPILKLPSNRKGGRRANRGAPAPTGERRCEPDPAAPQPLEQP